MTDKWWRTGLRRRSVVMSVSSEADSKGGQGSVRVAGVVAQGGAEVDWARG
jgi:hypothetical protein